MCHTLVSYCQFLIDMAGRLANEPCDIPFFTVWKETNQAIQLSFCILVLPSLLAGISDGATVQSSSVLVSWDAYWIVLVSTCYIH